MLAQAARSPPATLGSLARLGYVDFIAAAIGGLRQPSPPTTLTEGVRSCLGDGDPTFRSRNALRLRVCRARPSRGNCTPCESASAAETARPPGESNAASLRRKGDRPADQSANRCRRCILINADYADSRSRGMRAAEDRSSHRTDLPEKTEMRRRVRAAQAGRAVRAGRERTGNAVKKRRRHGPPVAARTPAAENGRPKEACRLDGANRSTSCFQLPTSEAGATSKPGLWAFAAVSYGGPLALEQQVDHLHGFAQPHVIGQAGAQAQSHHEPQPAYAFDLVGPQRGPQLRSRADSRRCRPAPQSRLKGPAAANRRRRRAVPIRSLRRQVAVKRRPGQQSHAVDEVDPFGVVCFQATPVFERLLELLAVDLDPAAAQQ